MPAVDGKIKVVALQPISTLLKVALIDETELSALLTEKRAVGSGSTTVKIPSVIATLEALEPLKIVILTVVAPMVKLETVTLLSAVKSVVAALDNPGVNVITIATAKKIYFFFIGIF